MANDVTSAKLVEEPEFSCDINDLEVVEKGIQQIWYVDDNGEATDLKETYSMEGYFDYIYCTNCQTEWIVNESYDEVFKKAKEHLSE